MVRYTSTRHFQKIPFTKPNRSQTLRLSQRIELLKGRSMMLWRKLLSSRCGWFRSLAFGWWALAWDLMLCGPSSTLTSKAWRHRKLRQLSNPMTEKTLSKVTIRVTPQMKSKSHCTKDMRISTGTWPSEIRDADSGECAPDRLLRSRQRMKARWGRK